MTIDDLLEKFRRESGDTVEPYEWEDEYLVDLYNEAVEEACSRMDLLFDALTEEVCQISVVADTVRYSLHDSVVKITKAYLVDSAGEHLDLYLVSRDELDRIDPSWRKGDGDHKYLIVDDKHVQLPSVPDEEYTMMLEVYRVPLDSEKMVYGNATILPTIASIHHKYLYHWPMSVVYIKDDADYFAPDVALKHETEFERYFGPKPGADRGRHARTDRPHRNQLW